MASTDNNELIFEVTQEADGGFVAECLTESIVTQGDTWDELRAMVLDAVDAFYFDTPKPRSIRLHLVRDEVFLMK
jgi:predicted RNase H-like HicB family nuclease